MQKSTRPSNTTEPADTASTAPAVDATCEAYFKRAETCLGKVAKEIAAPVKQSMDQTRVAMQIATAAQQAETCKMADEQFSQTVQMLKSE